jgi:hypothetical protein
VAALQCPFCFKFFKPKFGGVLDDGTKCCKDCYVSVVIKKAMSKKLESTDPD